jgi:hypothetical protein
VPRVSRRSVDNPLAAMLRVRVKTKKMMGYLLGLARESIVLRIALQGIIRQNQL